MGKPVVLVTGASSGIGRVTAEHFDAAGYRVFGTSRTPGATSHRAGVHMLPLDVRGESSVRTCVDNVQAEAGRIDVLVSNAGHMVFGPAEEVPLEDARAMFDTNFWGAARVVNAVLPRMRDRGAGHVVLVGSIAAIAAIPMNAFYAASKSALARYAEALRHETARFGIHVVLVEPADFRTGFLDERERGPCAHSRIRAATRARPRRASSSTRRRRGADPGRRGDPEVRRERSATTRDPCRGDGAPGRANA